MVTASKIAVGQDAILPTSVKQDAILLYICPILESEPRIMVTAPKRFAIGQTRLLFDCTQVQCQFWSTD